MEHGAPLGRALGQNYRLVQRLAVLLCVVAALSFLVMAAGLLSTERRLQAHSDWLELMARPDADLVALRARIQASAQAASTLQEVAQPEHASDAELWAALAAERGLLESRMRLWRWLGVLMAGMVLGLAAALTAFVRWGRGLYDRHFQTLLALGRLREARDAAETQAAERGNLLRALVATGPFGIHAFTPDGRPVLATSTLADRYGLQLPDMREQGITDVRDFPLAQAAGIAAVFDRVCEGETVDLPAVRLRVAKLAPEEGEGVLCVAPLVFPVRNQAGEITHVGVLMRDAMEQQALFARLQRAERLAAIGTLAAGVAHELNNPLTSLAMNHDLLSELVEEGSATLSDQRELLADMSRSLAQIQSVTGDLAEIARPDASRSAWCELAFVVEAAVRAVVPASLEEVAVQVDLDALPPVLGSPARVEQIFQQIIENAVFATKQTGGTITIRGRMEDDERVVVEVIDDGTGIPEDHLPRVFEPFYTTHEDRDGTGLGLYLVHVFVEEIGGEASIRSRPGEGTTVELRFREAPELTVPPSLDGLGSASLGVALLLVSTEALELPLRELVPEAAACRRVDRVDLVQGVLREHGPVDVLIWDAATMGPLQPSELPESLRHRTVVLDGEEPELQRPLDRARVLSAVEVVLFGGLGGLMP